RTARSPEKLSSYAKPNGGRKMDLGPLIPIVAIVTSLGWGMIGLKKRQLEQHSKRTDQELEVERAEKKRLEQRVAVLERIATDGGAQTAAQIEALRGPARLPAGEKAQ